MIIRHALAAFSGLFYSLRYWRKFAITRSETKRYLFKSVSLSLCYVGFSARGSFREAILAGKCGFICCAYDVATDWRNFDPKYRNILELVLSEQVSAQETALALRLYDLEVANAVREDGLERGVVAFDFIMSVMGSKSAFEKLISVHEIGSLCQIADDVLDYEQDVMRKELNCLQSPRRENHLRRLVTSFTEGRVRHLFPKGAFLRSVLKRAVIKAKGLLEVDGNEAPVYLHPSNVDRSVDQQM